VLVGVAVGEGVKVGAATMGAGVWVGVGVSVGMGVAVGGARKAGHAVWLSSWQASSRVIDKKSTKYWIIDKYYATGV
jgi:hypothetical protein